MAKWSTQDEISLFQVMRFNKPVGVNKHFAMINIVEQLKSLLDRPVAISEVWDYIGKLYNITALDEFETPPFPNDVKDFSLPEQEFPETLSDLGSESDQKQSVADSLELDSSADSSLRHTKSKASDRPPTEDNTPRRAPKRTRSSIQSIDTPAVSKRRRV